MRRGERARTILATLLLGLLSHLPVWGQAVTREYDLKAAFIYNLATFGEWPKSAFSQPDSPFVIGVLGLDPFGSALKEIIAEERIKGRPVIIRHLNRGETPFDCHILFVSASERRQLKEILQRCRGRPILTVGDMPGFIEAGGMVALVTDSRVRLVISPLALESAGLTVSSKLLRLAQIADNDSAPVPP